MHRLAAMSAIIASLALASCLRDAERVANVRDIGDAINHCRNYTRSVLPDDTAISIDRLSTRENSEYYDVYLRVSDKNNHGWVRCQVAQDGYIYEHRVHGMRHEGPSIFSF